MDVQFFSVNVRDSGDEKKLSLFNITVIPSGLEQSMFIPST